MSVGRIHRLIRLITLLQSGTIKSAEELAAELGVSRRTLFRDLNMLQMAGIPYYHDPLQGFRIARSFFLPPVSLTIPETLGLMLLGKATEGKRRWPLLNNAIGAIQKLIATVPEPIRTACQDLTSYITVDSGPQANDDSSNQFYSIIQRCIDQQRVCQVRYKSPVETDVLECRLEPYALHFSSRAWYVLGRSDLHDEVRIFKLARFLSISPLMIRFDRPRGFHPESRLGKAWQLIPEGKVYQVELEFTAKVATNVSEVLWHPSQKHEMLPDGRCRMFFEVDGLGEISWWLCGYADQVIVRKPLALRQRVQMMLREALQQYEKKN